jgi:hypothetical protein
MLAAGLENIGLIEIRNSRYIRINKLRSISERDLEKNKIKKNE